MPTTSFIDDITSRTKRSALAIQILVHPNITLGDAHLSGVKDAATARDNAFSSVFLMQAQRSCYENAPCGDTGISAALMESMLELARTYRFHVVEIAGGSHSKGSRHYAGVAMDVTTINGEAVSAKNKFVIGFMMKCKALGATEVLGPGNPKHDGHVHAAWPRPK